MARERIPVTIVVCVYDAQHTIMRCLDSLSAQTDVDFELIVIDDGSRDATVDLFQRWAADQNRITTRLITHERNIGLGYARNHGIREASGGLIGFVDGDDWIAPTFVERLREVQAETGADIVQADYYTVHGTPDDDELIAVPRHESRLAASMCTKLFRTSLFAEHGIWCPEHITYEDTATTFRLGMATDEIAFIDDCLYYYTKDQDDTIMGRQDDRYLQFIDALEIPLGYADEKGLFEEKSDELLSILLEYGLVGRLWDFFRSGHPRSVLRYYRRMTRLLDRRFEGWRSSEELCAQLSQGKYRRVVTSYPWLILYVWYSRLARSRQRQQEIYRGAQGEGIRAVCRETGREI